MPKIDFQDYYKVLGVEKAANESELRSAFRKMARKHHPDINPGDKDAEERFKQVNEAYEVLSDVEKRKLYDRFGEDWQRYREAGFTGDEPHRPGAPGGATDFGSWFTGRQEESTPWTTESAGDARGYSDFFETLFGGASRDFGGERYARAAPRPRRGQDIEAGVDVTFDEAFAGTTRRFDIQSHETCGTCNGSGVARNADCPACDGAGVIPRTRTIEVKIPAGVDNGSRIRVAGQGGAGTGGGPRGDVYLEVTVLHDSRFERDGSTLRSEVDVPLYTALLGGEVMATTPTGRVALTIPPETQQGRVFRLRGQGMPKLKGGPGDRGDLMARARVVLPSGLTDGEKALFEQLRDTRAGRKS